MENNKNIIQGSDIKLGRDLHVGDNYYAAPETKLPKELCLKIPRIHPDDLIGRDEELLDLRRLLMDKKQVVVVNGLGGIGKTTLAQGYLNQYYDDYQHIVWVSQLSDDVTNDFVNTEGLTHCLGISTAGKEPRLIFTEIITHLKSLPDRPNLLIIDNATAALTHLHDLLPHPPHWHLLATSREKIEKFQSKDLSFLSADDALLLFQKHCPRIQDETEIRALLATVDYHTLTIEILAKTAQLQRYTPAQLQKAITDDLKANVYIEHKGDKIEKVFSYLSSIFQLSQLTPDETWLAKQFICLPPVFHKYEVLEELINPAASEKADVFAETLTALADKGWLLTDGEIDGYKMHRIILEVAARQIPVELGEVGALVDSVSKKLSLDQSKDNPVDKFQWIPFGKAVLEQLGEGDAKEISRLQSELAVVLRQIGDYVGTKTLMEKALISDEKNFGPDHATTAVRYSNLAVVLQDLGEYAGAKILLEKALISDEKNFGPDHPATAIRYSILGLLLQDLGEYARAKSLLEKALISDKKNFGPDHPNTAIRYSNLATVLRDLGDYVGAKTLLEKAMISDEKNFGPDHPSTAIRYSNLATVLKHLGDYVGAKSLLEKAVQSDEKNFGPDHPSTASSYSNLALVLGGLGDYVGAQNLLEKAVFSYEKNFGPDHPSTARSYSNLALVLQNLGDYAGAKSLLEKAVYSDEKSLGSEHPNTAIRYSNLSRVLQDIGDYAEALAWSGKALAIFKKLLPAGHPHIVTVSGIYESIKSQMQP